MKEQQYRREFLTKAVELASTIPLLWLIGKNFGNRTSYYEIDKTAAQVSESSHTSVNAMANANKSTLDSLSRLHSEYTDAYYKSYTTVVPETTVDADGNMHTTLTTETTYRWEEPSNVPNHSIVYGWEDIHSNLSRKLARLQNTTLDLEKLRELSVVKKRTNTGAEGAISIAVYGPQIAALLLYEETIAKVLHGDEEGSSAGTLVKEHDTPQQRTRRSFLKCLAAIAGAYVSMPIVEANTKKLEGGRKRLEDEIEQDKKISEITNEEAFSQYFGMSSYQLREQYQDQLRVSSQTVDGVRENRVKTAFADFINVGGRAAATLDSLLGKGIPKEIGDSIKKAIIEDRLAAKSSSENSRVYTGLAMTGLAVAGAMTAVLLPLEVANEVYANKFEKGQEL